MQPVRFMIWAFLVAYFLPESAVQSLRQYWPYQAALRGFKFHLAPALSAVAILFFALTFANHYLFNIRDSFGSFCKPTTANGSALSLDNPGFDRNWTKVIKINTSPGDRDLCIPLGV